MSMRRRIYYGREQRHIPMGLNLASQDLATLEARTEGWAAGLQLAALSMQGVEALQMSETGF